MPKTKAPKPQRRGYFFYRKESLRTTWKFRLGVLVLLPLLVWSTKGLWSARVAQSLVCQERSEASDILLVENFNPDHRVYQRAEALQHAGIATRVLVPIRQWGDPRKTNTVDRGIAKVLADEAGLQRLEFIQIREEEPISLNAAEQIRDYLAKENLKSVTVVAPAFRSRRSELVYDSVFTPAGITVRCVPALGDTTAQNWTRTWHGLQDVGLQWIKLQYYRFYVLG